MIGRNIDNHSLEKKKSALLRFIRQQNIFLSHVFTLKMDKFVLKVKPMEKPRSITPQGRAKQYPGKFHADNNLLFCSTVMLLWITTKSQFLTSTFQLFHTSSKIINGWILFEASETTDIEDFIQVQNSSSRIESESLPWVDKEMCCRKHTAKQIRKSYNAWISIFSPV